MVTGDYTGDVVELRLQRLSQMFDSLDPSPFREQDLDRKAEEYVVESVREMHGNVPSTLVVHLEEPLSNEEGQVLENAVQAHFARRAQHLRLNLRDLLRQGVISLAIGVTFLVVFGILGQTVVRMVGESAWSMLARESLLIGGWVAMWKPLEIFLYAWWPIVGERRMHERLSRIKVRVSTPRG